MPMKVLFTGIPGVDLKSHVDALREFVKESADYRRRVHVTLKAEDHFLPSVRETGLLPAQHEFLPKSQQMIEALGLPKPVLRKAWASAFQKLRLSELPDAESDTYLCAHMVFYHQWTREFFAPVDVSMIGEWGPDLVVTLIDDTENCLDRLKAYGEMFGPSAYAYAGMEGFSNALKHMRTLFDWRAIETLEGERLASEIGAKHFCVATKHPAQTLASLIYDRSRPVVYLSHPITEPRRGLAAGDEAAFEGFIAELEQLSSRFRRGATLIEPTTIDEFRLMRIKVPQDEADSKSSELYLPRHGSRWPLPPDSMWVRPDREEEHPLDPGGFFDEELLATFRRIRSKGQKLRLKLVPVEIAANLLGVLIGDVTSQINARDHKLVEQADGLVVLRPVYLGNSSSGVEEEIRYHCQLCASGEVRRAGLWIYTDREDEFAYLCREWIVGYFVRGLADGSVKGTGQEQKDKQAIAEVARELDYCEDRAELAQQVLRKLADRGIRCTGRHEEKPLSATVERVGIDAHRKFVTELVSARPPYVELIEAHVRLAPGLRYQIRQGPKISLDDFVREVLEFVADEGSEPKKGGR